MTTEMKFRVAKAREVEAALAEQYGELERLGRQYFRLPDERKLMFNSASGSTWYSIARHNLHDRMDGTDLWAFAWTDEDAGRFWLFAIPVADLRSRMTELNYEPSLKHSRYSLHIESDGDGFRISQLDMDLTPYQMASQETRLTRALVGLDDPPAELVEGTGLEAEKLRRLLHWRLDGIEEQGDNFDFARVRRRLNIIQPTIRVLEDSPEEFTETGWQTVLDNLNAAGRQKTNVLKNNAIDDVRRALRDLLFVDEPGVDGCLEQFARLNNVGPSISGELIGWFAPERYPLRNGCAEEGLAFFGYAVGHSYSEFREVFLRFREVYAEVIGQLQPNLPLRNGRMRLAATLHPRRRALESRWSCRSCASTLRGALRAALTGVLMPAICPRQDAAASCTANRESTLCKPSCRPAIGGSLTPIFGTSQLLSEQQVARFCRTV